MSHLAGKFEKDGLAVLAVNIWDEPVETLEKLAKEQQLKQRILVNGREVADRYGVKSIPTNLWINRKGIVVDVALGFDDPKELEQKTKKLLADRQ